MSGHLVQHQYSVRLKRDTTLGRSQSGKSDTNTLKQKTRLHNINPKYLIVEVKKTRTKEEITPVSSTTSTTFDNSKR